MSDAAKLLLRIEDKLNGLSPSAFAKEELLDFQWTIATMLISGDY